jgi:hypothetical protein
VDHDRLERLLSALHNTDSAVPVLHRLCLVCVDHIGVDGASVTGVATAGPHVVESSDAAIGQVARLQVDLDDGPCLDAIATLTVVGQPDLSSGEAAAAWPRFAPAARRLGIVAAFAFPLVDGHSAAGTLDVYNRTAGSLSAEGTADAAMVANLAALAIGRTDLGIEIDDVGISVEPNAPWAYSAPVHNASGMLAERLGISVDEALLRLRALAFVQNRTVLSLSRAVIAGDVRVEPWTRDD